MATIKNIIQTIFSSQGAGGTITDLNNLGRAQTRLGQSSAGAGRSFSAQSQGLGGLVAAYAGAAATTFALQQAYDKLAKSARATQTLEGLNTLAANAGANSAKLLTSVREITNNQLTIVQAAEQTNLALSAGFSSKQIEGLSGVAIKASRALGRDLADAMTRVTRGSAKMETELLDELGIYTKIEPATRAYAAALGKNVKQLSEFERRQGFVNAVIAEGEKKFKAINTSIPSTAERIEALGTKIVDLSTKFGSFLADVLAPLADFLTNNTVASFSLVGATIALVASKGISLLRSGIESLTVRMLANAVAAENIARSYMGLTAKVVEANNAIKTVNIGTLMLTQAQREELVILQQSAAVRALSSAEMLKALGLINASAIALKAEKTAAEERNAISFQTRNALKQEMALKRDAYNLDKANTVAKKEATLATLAYGRAVAADNRIVAATTPIIIANTAALTAQAVVTTKVAAATTGAAARTGAALAGVIRGVAVAGALVSKFALALLGFATTLFLIVTVVGLVGAALLKMFGLEKQFTSFIGKMASAIVGFFNDVEKRAKTKALNDFVNSTLNSIANADDKLREIQSFTFRDKFLGVTIDITKTREDLINEVQDAIAGAGKIGFGEAFSKVNLTDAFQKENSGFAVVGGAVGAALGAAIAVGLAPFTAGLSTAFYAAAVIAGGVYGAAAGQAYTNTFVSEAEALSQKLQEINTAPYLNKYSSDLKTLTADQQKYALVVIDSLTKGYNGAELFNSEAKKALDLQVKTAIETIKVKDSLGIASIAATSMGRGVADIYKNFEVAYDAVTGIGTIMATLPDEKTIIVSIISDEKTKGTLDALGLASDPAAVAVAITPPSKPSTPGAGLYTVQSNRQTADILSGDYFTTGIKNFFTGTINQQEYEDFQTILLSAKGSLDNLLASNKNLTKNQRSATEYIKAQGISLEDLQTGMAGTIVATDEFSKKYLAVDQALSDSSSRALGNFKTLQDRLRSGGITQEEYAQLMAALGSSIDEAKLASLEFGDVNVDVSKQTGLVALAIGTLSRAQIDNIQKNILAVAALEKTRAALAATAEGYFDMASKIAFASKYSKESMSALDFSVAMSSAESGTSPSNAVLDQLTKQSAAAKNYKIELDALNAQLANTNLSDNIKQQLQGISKENVAGLEDIAAKSRDLQVVNGTLQVQTAKGWVDVASVTADALDKSELYNKSLDASVELGKQLLIDSKAQVFSLGQESAQLNVKLSNQRDSLDISQAENKIAADKLAVSQAIAEIENDTTAKQRDLEVISKRLDIQKQLSDAIIKQRETEISAIQSKAALEEAAAQSALDNLKAQKQEQQALLDLQSKASNIKISSLQAQTDPAIAEASIRAGDFNNIASVLSSTYAKQVELASEQSDLFKAQLQGASDNYTSQLDIIAAEKKIADDKLSNEIKILELQKKNALDLTNQAYAELIAQYRINELRLGILENEKTVALDRIDGDIASNKSQADLITKKAGIDKTQLEASLKLENEKATRAARQLIDQYTLIERDSEVKRAFLKEYQALLNEQARLTGAVVSPNTQISAAQDFSTKKEELEASIGFIDAAYGELLKIGTEAIDAQATAAQGMLTVELGNLGTKKLAEQKYFDDKIAMEKEAGAAAIVSLNAELAARREAFNGLVVDLKAKHEEITTAAYDSTEAQEAAYADYIDTVVDKFGELLERINSVSAAAADQINSLSALSSKIASDKSTLPLRQQEVALAKEAGAIQNGIALKQSELNLLKAQEAASGSSGLSAQERMLTLKKQEIEFQAELNKIEATGQEKKLQFLIEQGKKAATLFEGADTSTNLAGSIVALSGIFKNQMQLINLQKQQAEKAYKDELALIEIDRQFLEEEKKAKSGAAADSAKVIALERSILLDNQALARNEADSRIASQNLAVQQLEAERALQLTQAQIDGIRAKSDRDSNRARFDSIVKEAQVFSTFINEFRSGTVETFNLILSKLGKTIVDNTKDVDIGAELKLGDVGKTLDDAEALFTNVYGDVATKQGAIFDNIRANSDLSLQAANDELALLKKRKEDLAIIQKNEQDAADANAKRQAAGTAMELAEIDKREKELKVRAANAAATYGEAMDEATQAAASALQDFASAVVKKIGDYLVAQQTRKIEQAKVNESIINEALTATSEKLRESQSKYSELLSNELTLREELQTATETLLESQEQYISSIAGREGSVLESSKILIKSILDQKKKALELSKTVSDRLRLDTYVKTLEERKLDLEAQLTRATEIRLQYENDLAEMQKIISIVTDIATGKLGSFAKQIQQIGASAGAFSGGGDIGQAIMSATGLDQYAGIFNGLSNAVSGLFNAGKVLNSAGSNIAKSVGTGYNSSGGIIRPPPRPTNLGGAGGSTSAFLTTAGKAIGGAFQGFQIGSLVGALTKDPGMGSSIGGAIGGAISTIFASSLVTAPIIGALSLGIGTAIGMAATLVVPVIGAFVGALIGRLFSKTPQASASGQLTASGFATTATSEKKVAGGTAASLNNIAGNTLTGFVDSLKSVGIAFKDVVNTSIGFKKDKITGASLSFEGGQSFSKGGSGTSQKDVDGIAKFYLDSFVQGLRQGSLQVDKTLQNASTLQSAIDKFVSSGNSEKTVERLQYVLEYADKFSKVLQDLGEATPVTMEDALAQITAGSEAAATSIAQQYKDLRAQAEDVLGSSSEGYKLLGEKLKGNALAQLGLAEGTDGVLRSVTSAVDELNAGSLAVANIVSSIGSFNVALVAAGYSAAKASEIIDYALNYQLSNFITSIGKNLQDSIDILKNPAVQSSIELAAVIENAVARNSQAEGVLSQLNKTSASISAVTISEAIANVAKSAELGALEVKTFLESLDIAQLKAVIADTDRIDSTTKLAAQTRLAVIEESDRIKALKSFVKISREFNKSLAEASNSTATPQFAKASTSSLELAQMLGKTTIDDTVLSITSLINNIASGADVFDNFNSVLSEVGSLYSSSTITATQYVDVLDLLQSTTVDTIQVYSSLVEAVQDTASEISDIYSELLDGLASTTEDIGSTLIELLDSFQEKSLDILKIYDATLKGVATSGNEILDLRDASKGAYETAAQAVLEFEKANKLSGKTSTQVTTQIQDIQDKLDTLSSKPFDFASFLEFGKLTSQQRALQSEFNTLTKTEKDYTALISTRESALMDLAYADSTVQTLGSNLIDTRRTESETIQKLQDASIEFVRSQSDLEDITRLLAAANFNLNQARFDEEDRVISIATLLTELSGSAGELNREVSGLDAAFLATIESAARNAAAVKYAGSEFDTARESLIAGAVAEVTAYYNSLVSVGKEITNLINEQDFIGIIEPIKLVADELDIYSLQITDRFKGFSANLVEYLDTKGLAIFYGSGGVFEKFRNSLLNTLVVQGFDVLTMSGGPLSGFTTQLAAITTAYSILQTQGSSLKLAVDSLTTSFGTLVTAIGTNSSGVVSAVQVFINGLAKTNFTVPTLTTSEGVGKIINDYVKSINTSSNYTAITMNKDTANTLGFLINSYIKGIDDSNKYTAITLNKAAGIGLMLETFLSSIGGYTTLTTPTVTTATAGTVGNRMLAFLTALNTTTGFTAPTLTTSTTGTIGNGLVSFLAALDTTVGFVAPTLTTGTANTVGNRMSAFLAALNTATGFASPALTTGVAGTIGAGMVAFLNALNTSIGFTEPTLTTGTANSVGNRMAAFLASLNTAGGFTSPALTTATAGTVGGTMTAFIAALNTATGFTAPTLTATTAGTVGNRMSTFLAALDTSTGFTAPALTKITAGTIGGTMAAFLATLTSTTGFVTPAITITTAGTIGGALDAFLRSLDTTTGFTAPGVTKTVAGTIGATMVAFLASLNTTTGFTTPAIAVTTAGTVGNSLQSFLTNMNTASNFTIPTLSTAAGVGGSIQSYITSIKDTLTPAIAGIADVFTADRTSKVTAFKNAVVAFDTVGTTINSTTGLNAIIATLGTKATDSATKVTTLATNFTSLTTSLAGLFDVTTDTTTVQGLITKANTAITSLATRLQTAWDTVVLNTASQVKGAITVSAALSSTDSANLTKIANYSNQFPAIKPVSEGVGYVTKTYAEGGYVSGPGSETSDSIPAQLSNGEYVLKASAVKGVGKNLLDEINDTGDLGYALSKQGRNGDSLVAHVNSEEVRMLLNSGGSGSFNPKTSLLEFFNKDGGAYGGVFAKQEADKLYSSFNPIPGFTAGAVSPGSFVRADSEGNTIRPWNYGQAYRLANSNGITAGSMFTSLGKTTALGSIPREKRGLPSISKSSFGIGAAGADSKNVPLNNIRFMLSDGSALNAESDKVGYGPDTKSSSQVRGGFAARSNQALKLLGKNDSIMKTDPSIAGLSPAVVSDYVAAMNAANSMFFDFYMLSNATANNKSITSQFGGYVQKPGGRTSGNPLFIPKTEAISSNVYKNLFSQTGSYYDSYGRLFSATVKDAGYQENVGVSGFDVKNPFASTAESAGYRVPGLASPGGYGDSSRFYQFASGGPVTGQRDSVSAMLEPGEFVLRKQAVDRMGVDSAIRLNSTGDAGGDMDVEVNINNNGTSQTSVGTPEVRRENGKIVIDIILEDLRNNGPIKRQLRSIR